jgi:hypothetical protein
VKRKPLPVLQLVNITTWSVHLLVGRQNDACMNRQDPFVCTIQRKLNSDDIVVKVHVVELTVNVQEGSGVNVHGITDVLPILFFPCGHVIEIAAFSEERKRRISGYFWRRPPLKGRVHE